MMSDFEQQIIDRLARIEEAFKNFCAIQTELKGDLKSHDERIRKQEQNWDGLIARISVVVIVVGFIWDFIKPMVARALGIN